MDQELSPHNMERLTEREREILALVEAGMSNPDIATRLVLSPHTVAWHIKQIFSKLNVHRRTQAVAVARSYGLLDEPTRIPDVQPKTNQVRTVHHNLPPQTTPFVGRKDEIVRIAALLDQETHRMLTLVGPGGIGKTRLAIEVAAHKLDTYVNGTYFIALQPLSTPDQIIPTIATTIGVRLQSNGTSPMQQLVDFLREKSALLVLDNFEQLVDGAPLLSDILAGTCRVKLLVTSRESLNLMEEHLHNVQGLSFPEHDHTPYGQTFSAVELFLERARHVYPEFSVDDDLPHVIEICQLVNGMPLALELAAASLKVLSCKSIANEIRDGKNILATPMRNLPERHRSMAAVFDSSWQLLGEQERVAFQCLSVFQGGFTLEAAQIVAGTNHQVLQILADKSFIRHDPRSERYDVHELLRQYGERHLSRSPESMHAAYDRHCTYVADLLCRHEPNMHGDDQREATQELELELGNIDVAWRWGLEHGRYTRIRQMAQTFQMLCVFTGRFLEGITAFELAVERLKHDVRGETNQRDFALAVVCGLLAPLYVRVGSIELARANYVHSRQLYQHLEWLPPHGWQTEPLAGLAFALSIQGNYVEAERLVKQACERLTANDNKWGLQTAQYILTGALFHQGKYTEAQTHAEQALALSIEAGDLWQRAEIFIDLGRIALMQGEIPQAQSWYRESFEIREAFGDPQGMAAALNHLGRLALLEQDYSEAHRVYRECLTLYEEVGDQGGAGVALCGLGAAANGSGELCQAKEYLHRALQIAGHMSYAPFTFSVLHGISDLFLQTGHTDQAIDLLALVYHHDRSDQDAKKQALNKLDTLRDMLDPSQIDAACSPTWVDGRSLILDRVVEELLANHLGI